MQPDDIFKALMSRLQSVEQRVASVPYAKDGRDGRDGTDGQDGMDGALDFVLANDVLGNPLHLFAVSRKGKAEHT